MYKHNKIKPKMGYSLRTSLEVLLGFLGTLALIAGIVIGLHIHVWNYDQRISLSYIHVSIAFCISVALYAICITLCMIRIRACQRETQFQKDWDELHEKSMTLLNLLQCEDVLNFILQTPSMHSEMVDAIQLVLYNAGRYPIEDSDASSSSEEESANFQKHPLPPTYNGEDQYIRDIREKRAKYQAETSF